MSSGQARQGQVFKRCTRCNARVPERRCAKCGGRDTFTWGFVVDVTPKDAQGRLIGKRRQKYGHGYATRGAAQDALDQLKAEKKAGTHIDPSRMTFGQWLDVWHANAEAHGWEANTAREYEVSIRIHTKAYPIANLPMQALTSAHFQAHYSLLRKQGKIRRNREGETTYQGPLSPKTVQNIHIAHRAALNDAVAADPPLLRRNVAIGTYRYNRRKGRPEMKAWSDTEVWTFLRFTADDHDHMLWRTDLMTGARRGEVLAMRRRDCLLDRIVNGAPAPAIKVRQQWARDGAEGLCFRSLKTGDRAWRTIDIDQETAAALGRHLEIQEFRRRSWGPTYTSRCPRCGKQTEDRCPDHQMAPADLDLLFCHPDGSPFDPDVVTTRFERRAEECPGVIRIRFHDMRHSHATLLLEDGATEKYVAERLGDTVEMIHETYGHVTPKMRAAAVERLAARLTAPATARVRSVGDLDSTGGGEGPAT
jgi:integrase